jgi:hypothetical protein
MQRALVRYAAGEARVIPVLLRPAAWNEAPFAHLQALSGDNRAITLWNNQDEAFVDVVAGIRRTIEGLSLLPASTPHAALSPVWNVPYLRNTFFTGRDALLLQLRAHFLAGQTAVLTQGPQALSGLGGIGKTQVAVEYAYRYARDYDAVLWARAESEEALHASYIACAALLRLSVQQAREQEIVIAAVKGWFQAHRNWLLILDNADDLDLLPPFLPSASTGHILLTTRAWDMQRFATRREVEILPVERAATFLLQRAGPLAPDAELAQAPAGDRDLAMQLAGELGGLPLALDQAGAYLEATGTDLAAYQRIYRKYRQQLLQERRSLVSDHPDPVATIWSLAFAHFWLQRVSSKNS